MKTEQSPPKKTVKYDTLYVKKKKEEGGSKFKEKMSLSK